MVVLDSYSTDATSEIARNAGVRLFQRKFDNYANQRSYGLNEIEYKHPWLFMLDADEVVEKKDLEKIKKLMKHNLVIDGRNIYSLESMKKFGFKYISMGRKEVV